MQQNSCTTCLRCWNREGALKQFSNDCEINITPAWEILRSFIIDHSMCPFQNDSSLSHQVLIRRHFFQVSASWSGPVNDWTFTNWKLIWISSGVAKQHNALTVYNVLHSLLDESLSNQCRLASKIQISSRTDKGVHALANTAHFDLELDPKFREQAIKSTPARHWFSEDVHQVVCSQIMQKLNRLLMNENYAIRLLTTLLIYERSAWNLNSRISFCLG